jgi:YD repeat-containing protein
MINVNLFNNADGRKTRSDPPRSGINPSYPPLSRLIQVTDPSGTYGFTYDNLGRLLGTNTQCSFLTGTLTNSYTYDAAWRGKVREMVSGTISLVLLIRGGAAFPAWREFDAVARRFL